METTRFLIVFYQAKWYQVRGGMLQADAGELQVLFEEAKRDVKQETTHRKTRKTRFVWKGIHRL